MLLAAVDDVIVATAGVSEVGNKFKVRHRAEFGIDVAKDYWGNSHLTCIRDFYEKIDNGDCDESLVSLYGNDNLPEQIKYKGF